MYGCNIFVYAPLMGIQMRVYEQWRWNGMPFTFKIMMRINLTVEFSNRELDTILCIQKPRKIMQSQYYSCNSGSLHSKWHAGMFRIFIYLSYSYSVSAFFWRLSDSFLKPAFPPRAHSPPLSECLSRYKNWAWQVMKRECLTKRTDRHTQP